MHVSLLTRKKEGEDNKASPKKRKMYENLTEIKIVVSRSHTQYIRAVYRMTPFMLPNQELSFLIWHLLVGMIRVYLENVYKP